MMYFLVLFFSLSIQSKNYSVDAQVQRKRTILLCLNNSIISFYISVYRSRPFFLSFLVVILFFYTTQKFDHYRLIVLIIATSFSCVSKCWLEPTVMGGTSNVLIANNNNKLSGRICVGLTTSVLDKKMRARP